MTIEIPKKEPLNIVPFIDIMLVLLAMVLSVSTFIAKGEIPISLPESRNAQAQVQTADEVLIQVTGEGALHWNGEETSHEGVEAKLQALSRDGAPRASHRPHHKFRALHPSSRHDQGRSS